MNMVLDIKQIEADSKQYQAGNPAMSPQEVARHVGAGELGHEIDHERTNPNQEATPRRSLDKEISAHTTQSAIDRGNNFNSGVFDSRASPEAIRRAIEKAAKASMRN